VLSMSPMDHIIREFDVCRWPPPLWLIDEARAYLSEKRTPMSYKLAEYIRVSEYATKLFNTVHEALATIEEAEKNMTSQAYMGLIDSMHRLALVGERRSDLYTEMFNLAQVSTMNIKVEADTH
jgi:hypothetical protein